MYCTVYTSGGQGNDGGWRFRFMRKNYEGNTGGGGGVNVTGYFEGNYWGYYWDGGMIGVEIFSG